MLRIVLIRPGRTDFDEQRRIQGALDIPLNDQGSREVNDLAEQVRDYEIECFYYSSGEPSRGTAERMAERLSVRAKKLDHMQNLDHGLWQGMCVEEVRRKQPKVYRQWQEQPESLCPPEGEMLAVARQRVQSAMKKLLKKHKNGVIGLVVPEPLASLVRSHLNQSELGDLWTAGAEHCGWEVIEVLPPLLIQT